MYDATWGYCSAVLMSGFRVYPLPSQQQLRGIQHSNRKDKSADKRNAQKRLEKDATNVLFT